jgi:hypothetical protein
MKLAWSDIGRAEQPGKYQTRFGAVTVGANHLAIWKEHPSSLFDLIPSSLINPPKREFILGTSDAPIDWSKPD